MKTTRDILAGHAWTILPTLRHLVRPMVVPSSVEWSRPVTDPDVGDVLVRGLYRQRNSDTLVIVVHGLGGSPTSAYLSPIAVEADERGWSCLRLALRGSDGIGGDFYHAGLTADVHDALADDTFARYERIFLVGFSLGGHISLRATTEAELDERVAAVAAVCPPIDLNAGVTALDHPARYAYKRYILQALFSMYAAIARSKPVPTPVDRVRRARTLREYDALTVVPRHRFQDVNDYYDSMAIAGSIEQIARPTLMVHSRHDPMIPPTTIDPVLARAPDLFHAAWAEGAGHVFFPPNVDFGFGSKPGLGPQVLDWLEATAPLP